MADLAVIKELLWDVLVVSQTTAGSYLWLMYIVLLLEHFVLLVKNNETLV